MANKSKEATEISTEKEKIQLSLIASLSDDKKNFKTNLQENLTGIFGIDKTKLIDDIENKDIFYVKCEDSGRYYEISENRDINLIEVPNGEKTLTLICVNSNNEELLRKDYTVLKNEYFKTTPSIDGYLPMQNEISGTIVENIEITVKYYYVIDESQLVFSGLDSLGNITNTESEIVSYMIGDNSGIASNGLISKNIYDAAILIPNIHNNKKVTNIGRKAFQNSNIVIAYLSDNLTSIGKMAFQNCNRLNTVYIRKWIAKH